MPLPRDRKSWLRAAFLSALLLASLLGSVALPTTPGLITLPANSSDADIQKALDSLPPNGEVRLGPGTYAITRPLRLRHDNQSLSGSGPATILRLADHAQCPIVLLGPPLTETSHPAARLRLADLVIDGNRTNQAAENWRVATDGSMINNNGVEVWNATDVVVEHVVCRRCRSGGLVSDQVRRLLVRDFDAFDNQFDGLACYQTEESRFDGLRLHDNLAAGLSLDLAFNRNLVTNAVLAGNDLGIFMRHSRDNLFQNLTISRSRSHGVFMAQIATSTADGWQYTPGTECAGNSFAQLTIGDCGGKAFQVNDASCTNNTISFAHFLGNACGGLAQPVPNLVTVRDLVEY
jgi:hypothetical protein